MPLESQTSVLSVLTKKMLGGVALKDDQIELILPNASL